MELTLENYTEKTGFRFRATKEQRARIDAGTLTREQAFNEFIVSGGLERLQARRKDLPEGFFTDPTLTVDNYPERVQAALGISRRFRMTDEQVARNLTREQAFAEFVTKQQEVNHV